jgi:hypothetical protein
MTLLATRELDTQYLLHLQDDLGVRDGRTVLVLLDDVWLFRDLLSDKYWNMSETSI